MGRLTNIYVWTLIFVSLSLGVRFVGRCFKIKFKNSRGLKSSYKLLGQIIIGVITLFILINYSNHEYSQVIFIFHFSKI